MHQRALFHPFPPSDCDKQKAKHVYGVAIAFVSLFLVPRQLLIIVTIGKFIVWHF